MRENVRKYVEELAFMFKKPFLGLSLNSLKRGRSPGPFFCEGPFSEPFSLLNSFKKASKKGPLKKESPNMGSLCRVPKKLIIGALGIPKRIPACKGSFKKGSPKKKGPNESFAFSAQALSYCCPPEHSSMMSLGACAEDHGQLNNYKEQPVGNLRLEKALQRKSPLHAVHL